MKMRNSSLRWHVAAALLIIIAALQSSNAQKNCITEENVCDGDGSSTRPLPGCASYAECGYNHDVLAIRRCMDGTLFNIYSNQCDYMNLVFCPVKASKTCRPSQAPTTSPTTRPSLMPSATPSSFPSSLPSAPPTHEPTTSAPTLSFDFFRTFETEEMRLKMESLVFVSYTLTGLAYPSTLYTFLGLVQSLKEMTKAGIPYDDPVDGSQKVFKFYLGYKEQVLEYGQANLALFLSNAMVESIAFNTCDEFSSDQVSGRFAISNSCGQNGRSYQDEVCTHSHEVDMSCVVDKNMEVESVSINIGKDGREPPQFTCRPKEDEYDYSGYWDLSSGTTVISPYSNNAGRLDVSGCCFWGRGVLLTRGTCNIGKLNYYLGKRAYEMRGESRFPGIDFCAFPESTCASESSTEEMRWITGMFEWVERIQSYSEGGWNYLDELKEFVDGGMKDDSFILAVSSVVTRGCVSSTCSSIQITKREERNENFKKVMQLLQDSMKLPTMAPTKPPLIANTENNLFASLPSTVDFYPPAPSTQSSIPVISDNELTTIVLPTPLPTRKRGAGSVVPLEDNSASPTVAWVSFILVTMSLFAFLS